MGFDADGVNFGQERPQFLVVLPDLIREAVSPGDEWSGVASAVCRSHLGVQDT